MDSPPPSTPVRPVGVLGRPILKASSSTHHAKEAIMNGMDLYEAEINDLRNKNSDFSSRFDQMEKQIKLLTEQLNGMAAERDKAIAEKDAAEAKQRKLEKDFQERIAHLERQLKAARETEKCLREDEKQHTKLMTNLRNDLMQKEEDLRRLSKELDHMHVQVNNTTKRHFQDRDIELLHEVEMLKNQKREWQYEKQEMSKTQKKLDNELKSLQEEIESKNKNVQNNSLIHGVLQREFNQLLEENSQLKFQLHRRGVAPNVIPSTPRSEQLPEAVTVVPVAGLHTSDGARHGGSSGTQQNVKTSTSLPAGSSSNKPSVKQGSSRDYPLSSSERSQVSRSQTFMAASSKERSLLQRNASFSTQPRGGATRPRAASIQGRTSSSSSLPVSQSSESLPSLAPKTCSKGKS